VKRGRAVSIAVWSDDDFNVLIEFHKEPQKPFH
jgi:hypothetical protein